MSSGGRRFGKAHLPVESCHSLSAWGYCQAAQMWEDDDTFNLEWTGGDEYTDLTITREGRTYTQRLFFTSTPCPCGGKRLWFVCPSCGRRVGKVYLPATMFETDWRTSERRLVHLFKCRHCYRLTYLQRQDHRDLYWTYLHRADRVAERWLGEISSDWIGRKKGQHWRTFERHADQYEQVIAKADRVGYNRIAKLLGKSEAAE